MRSCKWKAMSSNPMWELTYKKNTISIDFILLIYIIVMFSLITKSLSNSNNAITLRLIYIHIITYPKKNIYCVKFIHLVNLNSCLAYSPTRIHALLRLFLFNNLMHNKLVPKKVIHLCND